MFKKHRKTASMGLLECCGAEGRQGEGFGREREETRLHKISLK